MSKPTYTTNDKYPAALGQQVYAHAAAGWTMKEIARLTGLPYTTVQYWLRINAGAISDIEDSEDAEHSEGNYEE